MTGASAYPRGRHVLAELRGVSPGLLDDAAKLADALRSALVAAGAQVRQVVSESFTPHGVTVVAVLAESHASVHTWPEHGQAFADVFTCGDSADPLAALRLFGDALGAADTAYQVIERGTATALSEPLSPGLRRLWELGEIHWQHDTGHQRVLIADTAHGVTLFCDDERQSAQASQLVYHEALFVPAVLLADRLDSVLVIGSSEGVVSQLAVDAGARVVDHVDIDAECVRACARHLPYGYSVEELAAAEHAAERSDGAVRVHYADGAAFVANAGERRWDVIVVDLPDDRPDDPAAQHSRLYGVAFLRRCAKLLTPGGVVVSQAGCPTLWRNGTLHTLWRRFGALFGTVAYHGSDEHEWAFLLGRRDRVADPTDLMLRRLQHLPYRPVSIDAASLAAAATPPLSIR